MDCEKIGTLICKLRKEKGLTQKQVADDLGISDKTVSKWERGMGCPDLSLWSGLAEVLGADVKKMLDGEVYPNPPDKGNIARIKFYVCPICGNVLMGTSKAGVSCCGMTLKALTPKNVTDHKLCIEPMDGEFYITADHDMTKEHYIVFVAFVISDRIYIQRMYPQQEAAFRLPHMGKRGELYAYCTRHGLWKQQFNI